MGAYDAVPQPYRETDLLLKGFGGLDSSLADYREKNAPGDSVVDAFINRVLAGEDPQRLAAEARANPRLMAELEGLKGQGRAADPRSAIPDVGIQNGMPAVMQPGTLPPNLSGAPQPGAPAPARPGAQPSLGAMPPRQPIVSGAYNMPAPAPRPSVISMAGTQPTQNQQLLGNAQAQYRSGAPDTGPTGPRKPLMPAERTPMEGLPGGLMPMPRPNTAVTQRPAPQPAPQAQAPQPKVRTRAEQAHALPFTQVAGAAMGRAEVARINAGSRERIAVTKADVDMATALAKQYGVNDAQHNKILALIQQETGDRQIAAMKAYTDLLQAKIGANSRLGAAQTRAATVESPDEKELRVLEQKLGAIESKPEWTKDDASLADHARTLQRIRWLHIRLGKADMGPTGGTPQAIQGPQAP